MPLNFLLIEPWSAMHHFYGESLTVECPTGSGVRKNLKQVAEELQRRRPACSSPIVTAGAHLTMANDPRYALDPNWNHLVLFHEYFDGDNGRGLAPVTRRVDGAGCASASRAWSATSSSSVRDKPGRGQSGGCAGTRGAERVRAAAGRAKEPPGGSADMGLDRTYIDEPGPMGELPCSFGPYGTTARSFRPANRMRVMSRAPTTANCMSDLNLRGAAVSNGNEWSTRGPG